jgi:PEP-CTERM motif
LTKVKKLWHSSCSRCDVGTCRHLRGGAFLKLIRLLIVAAMAISFTSSAWAQGGGPSDPTVGMKKIDPAATTIQQGVGLTDQDPLILIDGSGVSAWLYNGPDTNAFYIEVIPGPGDASNFVNNEVFTCLAGLAATGFDDACGSASPTQLPAVEFAFTGIGGDKFLTSGTIFETSVPEPNTLLLLVAGLAGLLLLSMKRLKFAATQS